jgi:hypothetical protein
MGVRADCLFGRRRCFGTVEAGSVSYGREKQEIQVKKKRLQEKFSDVSDRVI